MAGAGERILVLRRNWLDLILAGEKTIEVRGVRLNAGTYLLGCKSKAYGRVRFGAAFEVRNDVEWRRLHPKHLVKSRSRPYKRTWAMPIESIQQFETQVPYLHPRGAVGIVIFRPS